MNLYNSLGAPSEFENNESSTIDGYSQLNVYDWLANIPLPPNQQIFNIVEIKFKGARKDFYLKPESMSLKQTDIVIVETIGGHDVGHVSLTGELVRLQLKKHNILKEEVIRKIYRKATSADIKKWKTAKGLESKTMYKARMLAKDLDLKMKICDVDYQGDNTKATFYYTADKRVEFRELILVLAATFHVKIKMRQISVLEEASRLGGIGTCGREFCHSTWLTDFRSVNTSAARYQQLSLNPQKLAGQCGKLKCCLNFELDTYLDALKDFPRSDVKLKTEKGTAVCQKTDIFKGLLWFAYEKEGMNWHELDLDKVNEIIAINKKGNTVTSLEEYVEEVTIDTTELFNNVVGQDSLTRFDAPKGQRNKKKRNNRKRKPATAGASEDKG